MIRFILAVGFTLALASGAFAQASETQYNLPFMPFPERLVATSPTLNLVAPLADSLDEVTTPLMTLSTPAVSETTYNPRGTASASEYGLLSTRREDPEYRGFLQGLQMVAIAELGVPLNVAPLTAKTLDEQAVALEAQGVKVFIVDSPEPEDSRDFITKSMESGRRVSLISHALSRGFFPPIVVESPVFYGEVIAEEAIRSFGNVPITVAVIHGNQAQAAEEGTTLRQTWQMFSRVMGSVAPNITVESIDPDNYERGFMQPKIIVALTRLDSLKYSAKLRQKFPDSLIILTGESDPLRQDFEKGLFDVRVRPDYYRLLMNAIREERRKSEYPIILRPLGERLPAR